MSKCTEYLIKWQLDFNKLRRNPVLTPSEREYISERNSNAVKQSKNSLIFPGINKSERIRFSKSLWESRSKTKDYVAPSGLYHIFVKQTAAYLISNTSPYINEEIDYDSIRRGIVWFFLYTYNLTGDDRDLGYLCNIVDKEIFRLKRIGYWRYIKRTRTKYPEMFVNRLRFRCVRKVDGERRRDTAVKERTSFKIETVAMFALRLLKDKKKIFKYMTIDGRYKSRFLSKINNMFKSKFGNALSIRRIRDYINMAINLFGITKDQIIKNGAKYNSDRKESQPVLHKIISRYKCNASSILGLVAKELVLILEIDGSVLCVMRC